MSLLCRLLFLSGTIGGGGLPIVGDELTVCRRDGSGSSSGRGIFLDPLVLRAMLIMSSRSQSESSGNELSSSVVLLLMLVPRLREGPPRRGVAWVS